MAKKPGEKKKWWKIFTREHNAESESDDVRAGKNVSKVATSLEMTPEESKAAKEKMRQSAEALRFKLLEATQAMTPWAAKARPGDTPYPVTKSKSLQNLKSSSPAKFSKSNTFLVATSKFDTSSSSSSTSSGLDPPPIDENDENSRNSVRGSSFQLLTEDLARDAEKFEIDPQKRKWLQGLSPAELVKLRHQDEELWKRLIRENTFRAVASVATDEDRKRIKALTKRAAGPRVRFIDKVDIFLVPVGKAYKKDETTSKQIGQLELEKRRPT